MLNIVNLHKYISGFSKMGFSNLNLKVYVILYMDRKITRESEEEREREGGRNQFSSGAQHCLNKKWIISHRNGSTCFSLLIYQRNNDTYNLRTVLFFFFFTYAK